MLNNELIIIACFHFEKFKNFIGKHRTELQQFSATGVRIFIFIYLILLAQDKQRNKKIPNPTQIPSPKPQELLFVSHCKFYDNLKLFVSIIGAWVGECALEVCENFLKYFIGIWKPSCPSNLN
jgi:hypothetical protein